jgi:DNA-binding LytR/AlgR family response regulator
MSERRNTALSRGEGSDAATVRGAARDPDRTLESLRRRSSNDPGALRTERRRPSRVLIGEREHRLYPLAPAKIEYIESRGNYVLLHSGGQVFLSRDSMKRLSRLLANSGYVRIQRTVLLNLRSIEYAELAGRGRYAFTLSSGERVSSGTRYRDEILRTLPLTRAQRLRDP